jgi:acyl CoA:acetate/3-ketoacid CoA transferase beta subunit
MIITELGVMEITPEGIVLKEVAPGVTPEDVQKATGARLIISEELSSAAVSV